MFFCSYTKIKLLLLSLHRIWTYSTITEGYPGCFISGIKNELKKQNIIYEINDEKNYIDEDYRCRKHRRSYRDSDFSCSDDECVYSRYSKRRMKKYDFKISMWRDNGMN